MGFSLRRRLAAPALCASAALLVSACGASEPDVVAGKQLFVQNCGACHTLTRADTRGTNGPDLDEAFRQSIEDGMGRSGIETLVERWILYPNPQSPMPAKLVEGQDARNVAAYVAEATARPGEDTGLLATAVEKGGDAPPAEAENGVVEIPADPNGQLTYVTSAAMGPPGELTLRSPNESNVPHDIVIDDKGRGEVVQDGGVSEFTAEFGPGEYEFYCSVPGHREAGMEGKLTIE
jgi:mono/diheme cytochrome c family protein